MGGWYELARGCARGLRPDADGLAEGVDGALANLERDATDEVAREAVLDLVTARGTAVIAINYTAHSPELARTVAQTFLEIRRSAARPRPKDPGPKQLQLL